MILEDIYDTLIEEQAADGRCDLVMDKIDRKHKDSITNNTNYNRCGNDRCNDVINKDKEGMITIIPNLEDNSITSSQCIQQKKDTYSITNNDNQQKYQFQYCTEIRFVIINSIKIMTNISSAEISFSSLWSDVRVNAKNKWMERKETKQVSKLITE